MGAIKVKNVHNLTSYSFIHNLRHAQDCSFLNCLSHWKTGSNPPVCQGCRYMCPQLMETIQCLRGVFWESEATLS